MTTRRTKVPWSVGDKFLMIVLGLFVVLTIGLGVWFHNLDKNPEVSVPTPAIPSHNACDYYKAGGNAIVDDGKISDILSPHPTGPPSRRLPPGVYPGSTSYHDYVYSTAEKAALVNKNKGAIQMLRQGFQFPYQEPAWSFGTLFPHYGKFRGLAHLLSLQAQVDVAKGNWSGAMNADLDAVQLGETLPRGGPSFGIYTGAECQAIGRQPAWTTVEHLDAVQARTAGRRLEQIRASHVFSADILQEQQWRWQASLLTLMQQRNWPGSWQEMLDNGLPDGGQSTPPLGKWLTGTHIRFTGKRTIMANFTHYTNQIIADARRPYAARSVPLPLPTDPINSFLLPAFGQARFREVEANTQNALLLVTLALRAYKLEHGTYPATLAALVPRYLQSVPNDPFALSRSLHYKRTGANYLLYSVGPDGKDEGGTAIFHKNQPAPGVPSGDDLQHWVDVDSRGDIVAGVNP